MKVLQLISSSLGYYGAERVVVTLSAALQEMGTNVVVGAFQNTAKTTHLEVLNEANCRGLATEQIPCHGRFDRHAIRTLTRVLERHHIDIIHCHGIKPDLYAFLATRNHNIALVSTCHLWVFNTRTDWLVSALERCILHTIDRVVVVSDHIIPQLLRFGVPASVIYNGIDLEPFRRPASSVRAKENWGARPIVAAVGRLAPQKGLQYLLQAAPDVLRENPTALFVFVGDGPERETLESHAERLGIKGSVCFLGVREEIPELLSSIDVLAMPSLDEGLPMALLEAMASRRAVVATSVGAIPHVIQHRVNGLMLSPGDVHGLSAALRELLKCRELRQTLGERARRTVESHFSAAVMARKYSQIYREVKCS